MFHRFKNTNLIYSRFIKVFFFLSLVIAFVGFKHKEYYSLTKIHYDNEQKNLEVTMRYFIDDVDLTLNKRYNTTLELATNREKKEASELILNYINENFNISVNKKPVLLEFVGMEYEQDVVYFYLETPIKDKISQIEVRNTMLFSSFLEQENIVKVAINGVKKSMILTSNNNNETLRFDE